MGSRKTIGFLVDWISSPWHIEIINGVSDYLKSRDHNLICYVGGNLNSPIKFEANKNLLFDFVDSAHCDGLLILASTIGNYVGADGMNEFCRRYQSLPMVSIAMELDGLPVAQIDNRPGMRELMVHLIKDHGFKRIAIMKGPDAVQDAVTRFSVYRETLSEFGLSYDPDLVVDSYFGIIGGMEAVETLIGQRKVNFDVLIAANDDAAVGALEAFKKYAIRVPEQVAIVGYDDTENAKLAFPSLTTVRQSFYAQGQKGAELVCAYIDGTLAEIAATGGGSQLVIRHSCGCNGSLARISNPAPSERPVSPGFEADHFSQIIQTELRSLVPPGLKDPGWQCYTDWLDQSIAAFFDELQTPKPGEYVRSWKNFLASNLSEGIDHSFFQDVLSSFRNLCRPWLHDPQQRAQAEDLFHQVRILIGDYRKRDEIKEAISRAKIDFVSRSLNLELDTEFSLEGQLDILAAHIPQMGISDCQLSLYENPQAALETSRLIFNLQDFQRMPLGEAPLSFRTRDLTPKGLIPQDHSYRRFVEAVFFGDDPLGFLVLECVEVKEMLLENLRVRISNGIQKSLFVKEMQDYAQKLENEVQERMIALASLNTTLQQEITERQHTQVQLQQTLDELAKKNQMLEVLSFKDELTGLYNRRGFLMLADLQLKIARRDQKSFLIFFFDLDGLKHINDTYGHEEGDAAISQASKLLVSTFRTSDIVARLGGDEFIALAINTSTAFADLITGRLEQLATGINKTMGKPYSIAFSVGFAEFDPAAEEGLEDLMSQADARLYEQKRKKKATLKR